MENKKGFSAYEEIKALAVRAWPSRQVSVISAICGDDYQISYDGQLVFKGTSDYVRQKLNEMISFEMKKKSGGQII